MHGTRANAKGLGRESRDSPMIGRLAHRRGVDAAADSDLCPPDLLPSKVARTDCPTRAAGSRGSGRDARPRRGVERIICATSHRVPGSRLTRRPAHRGRGRGTASSVDPSHPRPRGSAPPRQPSTWLPGRSPGAVPGLRPGIRCETSVRTSCAAGVARPTLRSALVRGTPKMNVRIPVCPSAAPHGPPLAAPDLPSEESVRNERTTPAAA